MKKDLMEKVDKIDLQVLEINLNLLGKIDQIDHQEMERKKVLVLKENQVLEINLNLLERRSEDLKRWRKKSFGFKGKSSFTKKKNQNQLVLQITQSILEKNLQKIILQKMKKKALDLRVRKNLKVEIVDLKTLALKNTVKKELNLKIF